MTKTGGLQPTYEFLDAVRALRQHRARELSGLTQPEISLFINRKLHIPHNSRKQQKLERFAEILGVKQVWR